MLSLTIREIGRKMRSGQLSPSELCELCLKRISKTGSLNAFITVTADDARKRAKDSDERHRKGRPLSPLDGIPMAIKDNYCIEGQLTSCASKMLANYVPPYTATVVQRLVDGGGALVVGKTNMDEFAMGCGSVDSAYGPVRNPWTASLQDSPPSSDFHIAGGSSGGSAVAVASGATFGALASDTGGSTRNPASLCGIVGLKPSYGLLSRHGLIPLVNSMDVPGIHARCADDAALIFSAMLGHDPLDSTSVSDQMLMTRSLELSNEPKVSGLHIGLPVEYEFETLDPQVITVWKRTADLFADSGAKVTEVSLPHSAQSIACYSVLNSCEVASNFARYDGVEYGHRAADERSTDALYAASRREGFNEIVKGRILAGNYFLLRRNYEKYFIHAMKIRRLIAQDFEKVFADSVNFLLTPVTIGPAPLYQDFIRKDGREQTALQDICTQSVNMAGIPAVAVPICLSSEGLPLGLQLIGPLFSDANLLAAAKWMEGAVQFPSKKISDEGKLVASSIRHQIPGMED